MVDMKRWYKCTDQNPKQKGKYLLMVGVRSKVAGHTVIGVIEAYWTGREWDVDNSYALFQWKHIKPGEINKYPDFEKNRRIGA